MNDATIKELLLMMFAAEFDIESYADLSDTDQESFEYSCGMEWQDKSGQWHDAFINVYGNIYKQQAPSYYHVPEPEFGVGEWQGGEISIADWDYGEVECYVDSAKPAFTINFSDLESYRLKKSA